MTTISGIYEEYSCTIKKPTIPTFLKDKELNSKNPTVRKQKADNR